LKKVLAIAKQLRYCNRMNKENRGNKVRNWTVKMGDPGPNHNASKRKCQLFKTARAKIGCAHFKAGEIVAVDWCASNPIGKEWYTCTKDGKSAVYPEDHLTNFVL